MRYMLTKRDYLDNVYRNLQFYISPLPFSVKPHPILRDSAGLDYHPTSISTIQHNGIEYHNVRFVNYSINQKDGSYMMKDGNYSGDYPVRTQNVCWSVYGQKQMDDSSVTLERKPKHIKGLEDIRLYHDATGELRFTATTSEYSDHIRILTGKYNIPKGTYEDCQVLPSPANAPCEKNWLPIEGTNDIVYQWHPLQIGTITNHTLQIHTTHKTPWFFSHLRGSAVPIEVEGSLWCLTHFVEYSSPRKYFHCIVQLNKEYKPTSISLPFVFRNKVIEYSIGWMKKEDKFELYFSSWDDNPCSVTVPMSYFQWIYV